MPPHRRQLAQPTTAEPDAAYARLQALQAQGRTLAAILDADVWPEEEPTP